MRAPRYTTVIPHDALLAATSYVFRLSSHAADAVAARRGGGRRTCLGEAAARAGDARGPSDERGKLTSFEVPLPHLHARQPNDA